MITQEVRYAMVMLEELRQKNFVTVKQVSDSYSLSVKFLEQVAGKLRRAHLIMGSKGKNGGYRLIRRLLSMNDIFSALGSMPLAVSCRLSDECKGGAMCVEREIEAKVIGAINDQFARLEVIPHGI